MTQRGRAASRSTAAPRSGERRAAERPRGDLTARRARLRAVIEPVVTAAGYDLEDVSVSRAGRRHVVRIIVDGDSGINLDAVADISRAISAALDLAEESGGDLVAGEYQLEVSSPGVDRPLTLPRHWRRNVGRLVKVTATGAGQPAPEQRSPEAASESRRSAERQITGRVVAADDEWVRFDLDGRTTEWAYADLGPGRVQVEFSRLEEVADEDLAEFDDDQDDEDDEDDDQPETLAGNLPETDDTDDEDVEGEER
ncbi:ribosome maturation factor RimP [Micromonospora pisi]|uniref:Ribosome maturation factor RimP n=1 Tax=Micromonospora pisi TaxID=589240 RepID=A0A495JP77_9ACTN|nr:ribosome maturation factor RimP [Micromonospora pisi]RKR90800.1 ribosome maturation factor RimP [Micromonospora pisi]